MAESIPKLIADLYFSLNVIIGGRGGKGCQCSFCPDWVAF